MNKRNIASVIIFAICIVVLTINYLENIEFPFLDDFSKMFLLGGLMSYVIIYFIFVIIIQHFSKWRNFFYEKRIKSIRTAIERNNKPMDDFGNILFLSMSVNFFSVYFLLITTPNQIISRIPGFEGINLFSEGANLDLFEIIGDVSRIDYFFPLIIIGVVIVFILRFIRLRRIRNHDPGYPGTNPLLGFMYGVLGIMIIQVILSVTNIVEIGTNFDTILIKMIFALVFTVMGLFSIVTAFLLDRFVLRQLKLK